MDEGITRSYERLLIVSAAYRQEHGEWPTQARMGAGYLQVLAHLFDAENFNRLASHIELQTLAANDIIVGERGIVRYSQVDRDALSGEALEEARAWLGLTFRPEILAL